MSAPFPANLTGYLGSTAVSTIDPFNWSPGETMREWARCSRMEGVGKSIASANKTNSEQLALLGRMRSVVKAAVGNVQKLMAKTPPAAR